MVVPRGWLRRGVPPIVIVVAWKWIGSGDERGYGTSDADRAALEVALRLADQTSDTVDVVTVGPPGSDGPLREALAAGASRAMRIDAPPALASEAVSAALVPVVSTATWVVCGDVSADRGTGAVPAFLAAHLGVAQALGLIEVDSSAGRVNAVRRLDGGRREVLEVEPPAVLSVEGSVARLRRSGLRAELAARTATVDRHAGPAGPLEQPSAIAPYRPRARVVPMPLGDALARIRQLTDVGGDSSGHGEVVVLDPPAAAARILAAVHEWS